MSKLLSILTMTLLIGVLSSTSTTAVLPECKIPEEGEIPVIGGYYYLIDDLVCVRIESEFFGPLAPVLNSTNALAYFGTVQITIGSVSAPAPGVGFTSACDAYIGLQCFVLNQTPLGTVESGEGGVCIYTADYRISLTQNSPPVTYKGPTLGLCGLS